MILSHFSKDHRREVFFQGQQGSRPLGGPLPLKRNHQLMKESQMLAQDQLRRQRLDLSVSVELVYVIKR